MPIGTQTNAVRLVNAAASRAVPHVLPQRHVFTQHKFPFISDFFNVVDPELGPGQVRFQRPGSIKSVMTHQLQPKIFDFGSLPTQFTTSGTATGLSAGSTSTIDLTAVSGLKKYHVLKNRRTQQTILVYSYSTLTVTFYPLVGTDNINSGDKFDLVGSAYPDGATFQTAWYNEPTERSNYLQAHVNEVDIGWFAEKRKLYPDSGNSTDTDGLTQVIQHNEGRERAMLFGEQLSPTTVNGETIHTMDGLEGVLSVEYDVGGTVTMDEWRTTIMPIVATGGGGNKKAVAGNTVHAVFDGMMEQMARTSLDDSTLGANVTRIRSKLGNVDLRGSQPMDEREGEMLLYDTDLMTRMYLDGFDTALYTDLAPNNIMKSTKAWITVETLLVHNPESVVKLTNILG